MREKLDNVLCNYGKEMMKYGIGIVKSEPERPTDEVIEMFAQKCSDCLYHPKEQGDTFRAECDQCSLFYANGFVEKEKR